MGHPKHVCLVLALLAATVVGAGWAIGDERVVNEGWGATRCVEA